MDKKYRTFLRNYYLASSLFDFVFAYAIYNVYFKIRGLSIFEISILLALWSFFALVFEVPSGALADYWSRKKLLIIAPLIKALCFLIWFYADGNFYIYASGFLIWSLGGSFKSGTTEAILYDTLVSFDKKEEYEKILGRKKFYYFIALGISFVSGGFIAQYNIDYAILFSMPPLILSSFFATRLIEAPRSNQTERTKYSEYLRTALNEVKSSKVLQYLFVYFLVIYIIWDIEEYDQLYYHFVGLPFYAFGIFGLICSLLNSMGSLFAYKLKDHTSSFFWLPLFSSATLMMVGLFPSVPMIAALLLSYLFISTVQVLTESKIQHNIKSDSRATVTSLQKLFCDLIGIFLLLIFGLISKIWCMLGIYILTRASCKKFSFS